MHWAVWLARLLCVSLLPWPLHSAVHGSSDKWPGAATEIAQCAHARTAKLQKDQTKGKKAAGAWAESDPGGRCLRGVLEHCSISVVEWEWAVTVATARPLALELFFLVLPAPCSASMLASSSPPPWRLAGCLAGLVRGLGGCRGRWCPGALEHCCASVPSVLGDRNARKFSLSVSVSPGR